MEQMIDWNGKPVEVLRSRGSGVPYVTSWQRNVIRPGSHGWPPSLVKQVRDRTAQRSWFSAGDAAKLAEELGVVSMFQSLHSEDALTWSWFGTLALADPEARVQTTQWLYDRLGLVASASRDVHIDQWMRVTHPHELNSPSGPEVDARVDDPGQALIYVEAKWRAALGSGKGAGDGEREDQIVLRRGSMRRDPSLASDANRLYVVLGVSNDIADLTPYDDAAEPALRRVEVRWLRWADLAECALHPHAEEFGRYLQWKQQHEGA